MNITKSQLQKIIQEEIQGIMKDPQLNEFFGLFGNKKKKKEEPSEPAGPSPEELEAQKAQLKKEMEAIGEEIIEKAGTWATMVYQVYNVVPFGSCKRPGRGCSGLMKDYNYGVFEMFRESGWDRGKMRQAAEKWLTTWMNNVKALENPEEMNAILKQINHYIDKAGEQLGQRRQADRESEEKLAALHKKWEREKGYGDDRYLSRHEAMAKITKSQLQKIIQEELAALRKEQKQQGDK